MHAFIADEDRYGPTRLLQWNPTERGTNLMVFRVSGPVDPYTAALNDSSRVRYYETMGTSSAGNGFSVLVEDEIVGDGRNIIEVYGNERIVVIPPVIFRPDRSADLQLVGENPALQRFLDRLPEPIDAEIRRLTTKGPSMPPSIDRLTDRQRHVLTAALETGYYSKPRSGTLEEVAAEVDLAVGTVAEHVRKAEAELVRYVLGSNESGT